MVHAATPMAASRSGTAYGLVAEQLRREIREDRYPPGVSLPTELELSQRHGVSRQTVRRAFQDLVAEGLVQRIPGRGTFATGRSRTYSRSSGSIEELLALSEDTELEVVAAPGIGIDIEAAGRLHLDTDQVVLLRFRRFYGGQPYCTTTAALPVPVGRPLLDVAELAATGERHRMTVLSVVQRVTGRRIAGADQTVTAVRAPRPVAAELGCAEGDPVLRIDRLYSDDRGELVELAINHFDPTRYTYRFHMRASET